MFGLAPEHLVEPQHAGRHDGPGCPVPPTGRAHRVGGTSIERHSVVEVAVEVAFEVDIGRVVEVAADRVVGCLGGVEIGIVGIVAHPFTLPTDNAPGTATERGSTTPLRGTTLGLVPEGDTIHRTAAALRIALVGKPLRRFVAPRLSGPMPAQGRIVESVESHGKHLEIKWDDGLILHTHMRMTGSWHLYRIDEPWRRGVQQMRVEIEVSDWVAVCFNAPVVEIYREYDRNRHPGLGALGPDLCKTDNDLDEAINRLYHYHDQSAPVGEVLLDQHVACGVGNVYRAEVLWACEMYPFAPISMLDDADCTQLINASARMLRANLQRTQRITAPAAPGGLAVYGRNGQRCDRCGDTIEVVRTGEHARLLYWCPGCQTNHAPRPVVAADADDSKEIDPHPAAAKFLADLPWRRNDRIAG